MKDKESNSNKVFVRNEPAPIKTHGYVAREDIEDRGTSIAEDLVYAVLIILQICIMYYAPELIWPLVLVYVLGIVFMHLLIKIL